VPKDLGRAVALYAEAAKEGNAGAMHNLAVLVSEGAAGKADPKQALEWFRAAASYGVADSQYNLGVIYARGLGTAENLAEAYKWFAIAALAGDKDAALRRDEVSALLDRDQLAIARAAVKAFRAKTPPHAANVVTLPAGSRGDAANGVTAEDQKALVQKIQVLLAEQGYDPARPTASRARRPARRSARSSRAPASPARG
jgi:localization factor PodJL